MGERIYKIKRCAADMYLKQKGVPKYLPEIRVPFHIWFIGLFSPRKKDEYIQRMRRQYREKYLKMRKRISHKITFK